MHFCCNNFNCIIKKNDQKVRCFPVLHAFDCGSEVIGSNSFVMFLNDWVFFALFFISLIERITKRIFPHITNSLSFHLDTTIFVFIEVCAQKKQFYLFSSERLLETFRFGPLLCLYSRSTQPRLASLPQQRVSFFLSR